MAEVEVRDAVTAELEVGDEVVIRLPENPTTGYAWSIESMDDGLLLTGDSADREAAEPPVRRGVRRSPGRLCPYTTTGRSFTP